MARSLSNILLKGISAFPAARSSAFASSSYQYGMRFSTTVPNDPDTHDDFKPTNKLENSNLTLKDIVEQILRAPGRNNLRPPGETPTKKPASASSYQYGMRFSTTVPNDPDTHDDFKPTNKLENSNLTLKDIVEQDVKDNPVMIYMKGDPELPRCGFSSLAVRVLKEYRIPLSSRNILEDPELKNAVKSFSAWPTFPQIFINGEFIGGSDIILNMHQTGELEEKIKAVRENPSRT